MAIELNRLIKKVAHMDISLLAGKEGLHNQVSWIHMVETLEASDFLEGGEIAFATGLGLNNKVTLLELVKCLYEKKVAGIIVNTGPFIESIPQDVLDFCDAHAFPLFVVPWKIHLAEIMRIFCFSITKEDQKNLEIAAGFKNAIFFPKQEELYVVPLSQHGFHVTWNYAACVIKLAVPPNETLLQRIESLSTQLDTYMRHKYPNFAVFAHDTKILAVAANYTEDSLHDAVNDLTAHIKMFLLKDESFTIGVGKLTKSIRCLYKSYAQAESIQKLQEKHKIDETLCFYSDMGIYKLLMGIEDKEIIKEYYNKTIKPLLDYDNKNHSDLTDVLRCYLNHNGSVKDTADELFVHRNTINYKLNKIEELLQIDLSALNSRLEISIGFMLQDML